MGRETDMNTLGLTLTGKRVLVVADKHENQMSGGGLHIVTKYPVGTGRVVSISPKLGERNPELRVGGRISFRPLGGQDIEHRGEKYILLDEDDVWGTVEEGARAEVENTD